MLIYLFIFKENSPNLNCSTPNGQNGVCIGLRQCDSLFNLLQKTPLTDADRNFLRMSQCGRVDNMPKVCCPGEASIPFEAIKLPQPGASLCGLQVEDRIIGGIKATIDEFNW